MMLIMIISMVPFLSVDAQWVLCPSNAAGKHFYGHGTNDEELQK